LAPTADLRIMSGYGLCASTPYSSAPDGWLERDDPGNTRPWGRNRSDAVIFAAPVDLAPGECPSSQSTICRPLALLLLVHLLTNQKQIHELLPPKESTGAT
jgi:hypothetical protein